MSLTREEQLADLENMRASVKAFERDLAQHDWDTIERITGQPIAEYKKAHYDMLNVLQKSVTEMEQALAKN
jgi:hypothetical protein